MMAVNFSYSALVPGLYLMCSSGLPSKAIQIMGCNTPCTNTVHGWHCSLPPAACPRRKMCARTWNDQRLSMIG